MLYKLKEIQFGRDRLQQRKISLLSILAITLTRGFQDLYRLRMIPNSYPAQIDGRD